MRLADVDWSVLRGAVGLLVVVIAVSVAVVGASEYFWDKMSRKEARERAQLSAIRGKYQTVDEEEQIIETYLPRYRELESLGVIGRERRLDWIERLRAAAGALGLPSLRYTIDSQEAYEPPFEVPQGAFRVFVSRMRLTLGLLHEEDLLRLLDELDRTSAGLYSVSECSIRRVRVEPATVPTEANLSAACVLEWYTVRLPEETAS